MKPTALKDSQVSWGVVSRFLHWSIALIMLVMLAVGFYMVEVETDLVTRFKMTQAHKSFGFVAFSLGVVRIIWRLAARTRPENPNSMRPWERRSARVSHLALYCLMVALPISGWLMASASPLNDAGAFPFRVANMVFGLFELPDPIDPGIKLVSDVLGRVHFGLALGLVVLLLVHVAAALKHAFVDHDGVLSRMLRGG